MLPLNLSLRRLIKRYIPQFDSDAIQRYEGLAGLRIQIKEDIRVLGTNPNRTNLLNAAKNNATNILLSKFIYILYSALCKLYIARRNFAHQQGHFGQIPPSIDHLRKYTVAFGKYVFVSVTTLPILWINAFIYNRPILKIAGIILFILLVYNGIIPNSPPTVVTAPIGQQMGNVAVIYQDTVIATDSNPWDKLNYSLSSAPGFMNINAISGLISGTPPDTGSFYILVKVEDLFGAYDTTSYTLKVVP